MYLCYSTFIFFSLFFCFLIYYLFRYLLLTSAKIQFLFGFLIKNNIKISDCHTVTLSHQSFLMYKRNKEKPQPRKPMMNDVKN